MSVIAIVDDDDAVRRAVRALLRSLGHHVLAFASGEEFLHSAQLPETSCLITDVQMPGMSGIDLQARLQESGHRLPVIVITAFPDESVRKRAMQLGALSFLAKPLDETALTDCLDRALHPH
ncbi:MAG: response regulator [Xanthobacteraceae bacterium]|nr:response regulator [Xanthobacteraceae bacterium]